MMNIVKHSLNTQGAFYCLGVSVFPIIITDGSEGLLRSPESLSSFEIIPFSFLLLILALLMASLFGIGAAPFCDYQSAVICLFGVGGCSSVLQGHQQRLKIS